MTERKRVYRSPLRAEQARRTRAGVLDAATRCFLTTGYAATTMKDIAATAGVSVQTVFAQGSKASMLLACVDRAVVGDDEEVPLIARELYVRMVESSRRADKLAALHEIVATSSGRVIPVMKVFSDAAGSDPEIAEAYQVYEQRRFEDVRTLVAALEPWLREEYDVDRATDIAWALFGHVTGDNLMRVRGWSAEQYADLVVATADRLLLRRR